MARSRLLPRPKTGTLAVLDIGGSKVCCLIARIADNGAIHVTGIGYHESKGLKGGRIIDMDAAARAIGQAVQAAENMAGETIHTVVVSVSAVQTGSQLLRGEVAIPHGEVTESDIRRTLAFARDVEIPGQNELIHAIPVSFSVDGQHGVRDPKGLHGKRLQTDIHALTLSSSTIQNLERCVNANHLSVEGFCVDIYASSLSCLVEDELDLGCTIIDMGAATTSIGVVLDNKLVFADAVPVGGQHVTQDIARGLTTPMNQAERLKTLYGHAIRNARDESDLIEVPQMGEDDKSSGHTVPRSFLTGIIQPRLEETFELVRARLEASGFSSTTGRRVVLTGGASQLSGLRDIAALMLDKQIRIASPMRVTGLAEATSGPAFSSACGLLIYAAEHAHEYPDIAIPSMTTGGMIERVKQWLRENW
ncbi:MAG: ftsA [Alphaproteobacteria bacterium]|nr:ftsA [Alphaproteobacteria bacterium]